MASQKELIDDFLAQRRIAVAGVSRDPKQTANFVFRKLRTCGYQALPINPAAAEVEGATCYPSLRAAPAPIDGVLIVTRPKAALDVVRECVELGIPRVWMHRSFGPGSVSEEAVRLCREKGVRVIVGACPLMFCAPVDFGHRCMRWILSVRGDFSR